MAAPAGECVGFPTRSGAGVCIDQRERKTAAPGSISRGPWGIAKLQRHGQANELAPKAVSNRSADCSDRACGAWHNPLAARFKLPRPLLQVRQPSGPHHAAQGRMHHGGARCRSRMYFRRTNAVGQGRLFEPSESYVPNVKKKVPWRG
jgi:hypothetical protein